MNIYKYKKAEEAAYHFFRIGKAASKKNLAVLDLLARKKLDLVQAMPKDSHAFFLGLSAT